MTGALGVLILLKKNMAKICLPKGGNMATCFLGNIYIYILYLYIFYGQLSGNFGDVFLFNLKELAPPPKKKNLT